MSFASLPVVLPSIVQPPILVEAFAVTAMVFDFEGDRWRGQMMMLAGIGLLVWVLFRRQMKMRSRGRRQTREAVDQKRRWESQSQSGAPLADAPAAVAKWQAGMYDLQRDLKAELESRISVLQSLVRLADERIAVLSAMEQGAVAATQSQPAGELGGGAQGRERAECAISGHESERSDRSVDAGLPRLREQAAEVRRLAAAGWTSSEIARQLRVSLGDVEFLQGIG
jgi:hypothetical protein